MDFREHIANNVRMLRAYRSMSQGALSKATGVSKTTISAIERSECNVAIDTLVQLVKALDSTIEITFKVERPGKLI